MVASQAALLPCFLVNNVTNNSLEQCKFIIDNDCLEDESVLDYVYLVYCEFGQELRNVSIALIVFLVIVLFLALSAVADEFLCPSLLAVAKNLRMSDSLAGVTLLAFGNGCPDIFSSLAAASDGRGELIVGELLGAGIFCTSIVSGIIFIHSDFKLACRPILRDTTFYLLAVYLIWSYCWSEEITFYGSLTFILIYVIYLIVALSGQAVHSRLQGNYAIAETHSKSLIEEKEQNDNWFKWREESLRRRQLGQNEKKLETSSLQWKSPAPMIEHVNGVTSIHLGFDSLAKCAPRPNALELQLNSSSIKLTAPGAGHLNKAFQSLDETPNEAAARKERLGEASCEKLYKQPVLKLANDSAASCKDFGSAQAAPNLSDEALTFNELDEFLAHVNPIDSVNWPEMSLMAKVVCVMRAPLLLAALLTVPVLDYDRSRNNWCRLLNSLHCITVPVAFTLATHLGSRENLNLFGLPLPVLVLIPGASLAAFVLKTTQGQQPPSFHSVFAYFGFIMSILWIYLLATEIISLLKTVGIMFSMSDTAIGLGVLAWGNSLGDIVANISLAEAGYPRMAIGASIGAPLLNLLLGFGLSFSLNLKPGLSIPFEYSPTITLLCSTLAIILVSLMLSTLASPERSKKPFGYLLISCYGVYFALAVCLEYGIIKV